MSESSAPPSDPLPAYTVRIDRLDVTLAVLRIEFAGLATDVEVVGRLMGPRCPGTSTIEVAYPLRPAGEGGCAFQVIIPDPTLWTAERPCVYEGPVAFRRHGTLLGTRTVSVGIRAQ